MDHQSETVNAYVLSSASYATAKLFIDIKAREYGVENKPFPPGVDGSRKKSRFYKEGRVQFGRDIFGDFGCENRDYEQILEVKNLISRGKFTCYQLEDMLRETFANVRDHGAHRSVLGLYLRVLAYSVGEQWGSACMLDGSDFFFGMHISEETVIDYNLCVPGGDADYSKANIKRNLARESACASPDLQTIDSLRPMLIRRSHGWFPDDD